MDDLRKAAEMALWGLKQSIGLHIRNDEELEPIIEYLEAALAQPQTSVANLDVFTGVTFSNPPHGGWIGDVEMVKWLVLNRDKDYWEHKVKT